VSVFDLRGLLEVLVRHEVRFVVIGGVAVGAHGYVRGTADLDIVPDPDRENLRRLRGALAELDATLPLADGRPFDAARDAPRLEARENMTFETALGGLDVVQRAANVPSFPALDRDASDAELLGIPVRVCSLPHLRLMKEATGRIQDLADLEHLPSPD
jgi:hypothetical protein